MLFYHQISIKQEGLLIKRGQLFCLIIKYQLNKRVHSLKEVNYAVLSSYVNLTRGFIHKKRSIMLFYHHISSKQEGSLIKRGQLCCFIIKYQ